MTNRMKKKMSVKKMPKEQDASATNDDDPVEDVDVEAQETRSGTCDNNGGGLSDKSFIFSSLL